MRFLQRESNARGCFCAYRSAHDRPNPQAKFTPTHYPLAYLRVVAKETRMSRHPMMLIAALLAALVVTGCGPNPAPDKPRKPAKPVGSTQLRDAIQRPLDRANAVEGKIEEEKEKQDQAVQDQGG
jgi:hypothetical protein